MALKTDKYFKKDSSLTLCFESAFNDMVHLLYWKSISIHSTITAFQEKDKNGDIFPMWGTCQGFQLISALVSKQNLLTSVDAEDLPLPLNFTTGLVNQLSST
jgi:hypothetical protein